MKIAKLLSLLVSG